MSLIDLGYLYSEIFIILFILLTINSDVYVTFVYSYYATVSNITTAYIYCKNKCALPYDAFLNNLILNISSKHIFYSMKAANK